MKLACSSSAFDELLADGELTQLEWIDLCAHELAFDGVVFDVRHFPRADTDYLAQVKKMAVDLGLCVAALRHDGFFTADAPDMQQTFEMALALGSPLVCTALPPQTAVSWSDVLGMLSVATSFAKRFNVTIALRNTPAGFAASTHDLKRVSKEADSAWLRFAPEFGTLEAGSEPDAILGKTVLVWADMRRATSGEIPPLVRLLRQYRGFVALDDTRGVATADGVRAVRQAWQAAIGASS